ncbi:MAG TPA: hypothetical protein VFA38_02025, partial [Nitrospirales bacterium]|nr:hypothetical protein [Nitrospirales bacterium]
GTSSRTPQTAPRGVYFRTPLADLVRDVIGQVVAPARQQRVSVFVSISPRDLGWLEPGLGWQDRVFNPVRQQYEPAIARDLFHPALQQYLAGLLLDLAGTGIDGVVFDAEPVMSSIDGFSPYALAGFERDFHMTVAPESWNPWPVAGDIAMGRRIARTQGPTVPPDFWRWTGWKARERMKVLGQLVRTVRAKYPAMLFAMDVHAEAGQDPVAALLQYSEDALEAKLNGLDVFVVRRPVGATPVPAAVRRLTDVIGDPRRVWVTVPVSDLDPERLNRALDPSGDRSGLDAGSGLFYVERLSER